MQGADHASAPYKCTAVYLIFQIRQKPRCSEYSHIPPTACTFTIPMAMFPILGLDSLRGILRSFGFYSCPCMVFFNRGRAEILETRLHLLPQ
jgi:hypothetical protein